MFDRDLAPCAFVDHRHRNYRNAELCCFNSLLNEFRMCFVINSHDNYVYQTILYEETQYISATQNRETIFLSSCFCTFACMLTDVAQNVQSGSLGTTQLFNNDPSCGARSNDNRERTHCSTGTFCFACSSQIISTVRVRGVWMLDCIRA